MWKAGLLDTWQGWLIWLSTGHKVGREYQSFPQLSEIPLRKGTEILHFLLIIMHSLSAKPSLSSQVPAKLELEPRRVSGR